MILTNLLNNEVAMSYAIVLVIVGCFSTVTGETTNQIGSTRIFRLKLHGGCDSSKTSIEADALLGEDGLHETPDGNPHMQMFWRDYGIQKLAKAMSHGNLAPYGPKCTCLPCAVSGRVFDNCDNSFCCKFKPWFEGHVAACGLVVGYHPGIRGVHVDHDCDPNNGVWDVDCHLMYIGRDDWRGFGYGSRLWKAENPNDPELLKLKQLFAVLDDIYKVEESAARAA
jgi:hypothetical protein